MIEVSKLRQISDVALSVLPCGHHAFAGGIDRGRIWQATSADGSRFLVLVTTVIPIAGGDAKLIARLRTALGAEILEEITAAPQRQSVTSQGGRRGRKPKA